jgi:hypothetical protein
MGSAACDSGKGITLAGKAAAHSAFVSKISHAGFPSLKRSFSGLRIK